MANNRTSDYSPQRLDPAKRIDSTSTRHRQSSRLTEARIMLLNKREALFVAAFYKAPGGAQ